MVHADPILKFEIIIRLVEQKEGQFVIPIFKSKKKFQFGWKLKKKMDCHNNLIYANFNLKWDQNCKDCRLLQN